MKNIIRLFHFDWLRGSTLKNLVPYNILTYFVIVNLDTMYDQIGKESIPLSRFLLTVIRL